MICVDNLGYLSVTINQPAYFIIDRLLFQSRKLAVSLRANEKVGSPWTTPRDIFDIYVAKSQKHKDV